MFYTGHGNKGQEFYYFKIEKDKENVRGFILSTLLLLITFNDLFLIDIESSLYKQKGSLYETSSIPRQWTELTFLAASIFQPESGKIVNKPGWEQE